MTKFKNILLIAILFNLIGCGVAGWQGYYQTYPKTTVNKYIAESVINSTLVTFADNDKMWLELPSGCNFFATTAVVPEPKKGSNIRSPFCEVAKIIL